MLAEKLLRVCLEVLYSVSNFGEMPGKIMIKKTIVLLQMPNVLLGATENHLVNWVSCCHDML